MSDDDVIASIRDHLGANFSPIIANIKARRPAMTPSDIADIPRVLAWAGVYGHRAEVLTRYIAKGGV